MFQLPDIEKIAPGIVDKLMNLYTNLKERKMSYEVMASGFKDEQLQRSVFSLAQESNQYASELRSQIFSLGGGVDYGCDPLEDNSTSAIDLCDEEKIEEICLVSENKILGLYKELLEDQFLFLGLRRMVQYQMDGFNYIISQLRLEKSLYKS